MRRAVFTMGLLLVLSVGCRRAPSPAAPGLESPDETPPARTQPAAAPTSAQPASQPRATDWPQWRGPGRLGISAEKGLLKQWPEGGPRLAWSIKGLGEGYSTPAITGGRIYGMSYRGEAEVVWALREEGGKEVWSTRIAAANRRIGVPDGSRCTPTVNGSRVYALGVSGDLACLDAGSGHVLWQKNLVSDFGGQIPDWGYSESPLVDGDRVVVTPGRTRATLVALNKANGTVIWQAQVPESGRDGTRAQYASVVAGTAGGARQYVQFLRGGVVGVRASDGAFLWQYDRPANKTANCATPIFTDGYVFAASSYDTGGGLAQITGSDGRFTAREVYFTPEMKNHHGGVILLNGYLYGANDHKGLTCLDVRSGNMIWAAREAGKGSVTYADGCLYFRNESGPMILCAASPQGYQELGRFQQPYRSRKNAWPHPVIANGRLYLRDQDALLCYDVKAR
ncbi:MAG: PQQ-binding-like beta-propeller repeat protein [Armatimonadetes bacterium]|nr:PQQ-binding-like beta-propeller repeat protein [Armatimonadota bacterium]